MKNNETNTTENATVTETVVSHVTQLCYEASLRIQQFLTPAQSFLTWENLSEEHKSLACKSTLYLFENPLTDPITLHEAWKTHMENMGWKYGGVINSQEKTHPRVLEFGLLDRYEQNMYCVTLAIVNAFR